MSTRDVLLVEDDLCTREFLTDVLAEMQVGVVVAGTMAVARETLIARPDIRLALVDRILPDGDGRELCYDLKKIRPGLNIVQMSSHPAGEVDVDVIHSILDKPFTIETLEMLVMTLLEGDDTPVKGARASLELPPATVDRPSGSIEFIV